MIRVWVGLTVLCLVAAGVVAGCTGSDGARDGGTYRPAEVSPVDREAGLSAEEIEWANYAVAGCVSVAIENGLDAELTAQFQTVCQCVIRSAVADYTVAELQRWFLEGRNPDEYMARYEDRCAP